MTNLHPIWNGERLPMSLTIDSSSLVRHWSYQDGLKENDLHYLSAKKNGFINNLIVTCEVKALRKYGTISKWKLDTINCSSLQGVEKGFFRHHLNKLYDGKKEL